MKKVAAVVAAVALALLILFGAVLLIFPTADIRIGVATIQEAIDKRLPLNGDKLGVSYRVDTAAIEAPGDERLRVKAEIEASAFGREVDLEGDGSGLLNYRDGEFFVEAFILHDARVIRDEGSPPGMLRRLIEGSDFASKAADKIRREAIEIASPRIAGLLAERPVYRLRDDLAQTLLRASLVSVKVEGGALVVRLDTLAAAGRLLLIAGVWLLSAVLAVSLVLTMFLGLGSGRDGSSGGGGGFFFWI